MVDEFRSTDPDGLSMLGASFRSFNAATGKWTTRWYDAVSGRWLEFDAVATSSGIEGTHPLETPDGPATFRIRFFNIKADSFQWRGDLSTDGGKTWQEGMMQIWVERDNPCRNRAGWGYPPPDAVDPEHIQLEFENESVRVTRATYAAGDRTPMHGHGDRVNIFLTDALFQVIPPEGQPFEGGGQAGEASWSEASAHSLTARTPSEVITVEVKENSCPGSAARPR